MRSSKRQVEEFLKSTIWTDLKEMILLRLSDVRDELEHPEMSREQDLMNKGRAEELRWVNELPQELYNQWEQINKEEQDDIIQNSESEK